MNAMAALYQIPQAEPPALTKPDAWPADMQDFITIMLVKEPAARPCASELLQVEERLYLPHCSAIEAQDNVVIHDLHLCSQNQHPFLAQTEHDQVLLELVHHAKDPAALKRHRKAIDDAIAVAEAVSCFSFFHV